ncbi:hypothetical protein [Maribacter sp. 2308TA10-17]|uniref:hypothetical protein n=1 Tax=Maribacter sp. 2308TA10-17 TaxID=3386276 RepID=UPI0039BD3D8F
MKRSLKNLLLLGILAELVIFSISYWADTSPEVTFRYAARFSGRLSAFTFLFVFYLFAKSFPSSVSQNKSFRNGLILFAMLHLIHFGFLATNVYLNEIPLVPTKLAGGALAYVMIVFAPFVLHKVKPALQLVYFYYVSIVMFVTYLARAKGDFQGAEPNWFHYMMLLLFISSSMLFGFWMIQKNRKVSAD